VSLQFGVLERFQAISNELFTILIFMTLVSFAKEDLLSDASVKR
jgi:hypothetical protein